MKYIVIRNDITNMAVDAIVLPANPELKECSGASTAIFKKTGRENLELACKRIVADKGRIHVGTAVPTLGFDLDSKYIIHAVVPQWRGGNKHGCLTPVGVEEQKDYSLTQKNQPM